MKPELKTSVMLMGTDLKPRGPKKNKGKAKVLDHLKPNGKVEKKKGKENVSFVERRVIGRKTTDP